MSDELITGSVHGDLSTSGIERGQAHEGLRSSNLDQDKREMSKPYGRQEIFHKALEAAANREREQRRALSVSEVQAEIWKVINEFHITGPGVSGQGTEWSVHPPEPKPQRKASDSAAILKHPFKVLDASDGGVDKVKTYKGSFLYPTTNLATPYVIADLDTATAVSAGDVVFLEIDTDSDLALSAATNMIGAAWGDYDDMYSLDNTDPDNPFSDAMFVLLAEIVDKATEEAGANRDGLVLAGTGTLKVIQHQRNNILLFAYPDVVDAAAVPVYIPISI